VTEANLRDPNWIGRRAGGVPSYRPMPTVAARELMLDIEARRSYPIKGSSATLARNLEVPLGGRVGALRPTATPGREWLHRRRRMVAENATSGLSLFLLSPVCPQWAA
jgi:hypothetical protein